MLIRKKTEKGFAQLWALIEVRLNVCVYKSIIIVLINLRIKNYRKAKALKILVLRVYLISQRNFALKFFWEIDEKFMLHNCHIFNDFIVKSSALIIIT